MKIQRTNGFSLVEVAMALGIASFCVIALLGLFPIGLNSTRNASEKASAMNLAMAVAADLKSTPLPLTTGTTPISFRYQLPLPLSTKGTVNLSAPTFFADEAGQMTTLAKGNARYLVTITMRTPANPLADSIASQIAPTNADIRVSWPAAASLDCASGSVEIFTTLDRW